MTAPAPKGELTAKEPHLNHISQAAEATLMIVVVL